MKITFFLSHLAPAGPNIQFHILISSLVRKKYIIPSNIEFVIFKNRNSDWIENDFLRLGLKITKFKNYFGFVRYVKALLYVILLPRQIVVSYGLYTDILCFFNYNNSRHYSFVHSFLRTNYYYRFGRLFGLILTEFHIRVFRRMERVFSISSAVQADLLKEGIKSFLVENCFIGVRVDSNLLDNRESNAFITISSKIKGKNVEYLCEYFKTRPNLKLIVLGYCNFSYNYLEYPNIIFKGFIKDVYAEYSKARYFISASTHEGLPNAPIEALYMGCIVILSDIPAHTEIVDKVSNFNCEIFSLTNNGISLAGLLSNLGSFNVISVSEIRKKVLEVFNPEIMINQFMDNINSQSNV